MVECGVRTVGAFAGKFEAEAVAATHADLGTWWSNWLGMHTGLDTLGVAFHIWTLLACHKVFLA